MYTIGKLAELSATPSSTIRYYERAGLMGKPSRGENGYRKYTDKDLHRLTFIRHCRHHNLPMEAIKTLLSLQDVPSSNCEQVGDIIDKQIERLEELSKCIQSLIDTLVSLRNKCARPGAVSQCGIMKGLMDEAAKSPDSGREAPEGSPRIIWPA
ncbi:MAG: MerR family transcriptional regulator [Deltaproteobacteria bacterium]|jgi:DNA-binding transcriptional MerR regulator|nr:MerR family transcriptional regulator [Deltaproteobacteria bacterium]